MAESDGGVRHRVAPGLHRAHTQARPDPGLGGRRRGRPGCLPQGLRNILTYTCPTAGGQCSVSNCWGRAACRERSTWCILFPVQARSVRHDIPSPSMGDAR
jgi:hypothetical protein